MQRSDSRLEAFSELIQQRRLSGSFSEDLTRLQQDLHLSAEIGQELVIEVTGLKERLNVADVARDQLLDRLAASYRANAALEKRLDRQTAALEAAEASNRSLLATHEDDRKTIGRLMADQARTSGMDDKIRLLIRERDDLRQELDAQSRKASVAETKAKRASVRLTDIEARMTSDFNPEKAQTPSSPSRIGMAASMVSDRTAKPRKRNPSDTSFLAKASGVTADTAPVELLRLIETLVQQNASARNEAQELQAMLDASREEQYAMQNEVMNMQQPWLMESSKESRRRSIDMKGQRNFANELMNSINSEPIPAMSPTLVDEPSSQRQNWSPLLSQSASFQQQRNPLSCSNSDAGSDYQGPLAYHLPDGSVRPAYRSRRSSSKGSTMVRPASRRAKSVDMTTLYQEDPNGLYDSRNSLEPIADASPIATRQTPSQATPQRSEPVSPTASRTANHLSRSTATNNSLFNNTQDASSQTELTSDLSLHSPIPFFRSSTPAYSASTTSDDHHLSLSPGDSSHIDLPQGDRTGGLLNLIEHANKLLTRLKGANVASLEVRLKKQNLPGDVGHLAKSTVKDIMSEIEAMRELFRKLFDQERNTLHTESETSSSLVGRRDFFILVRLLRDTLSEIGRLRSIINQVQIDPALASKIGDLDAGEPISADQPAPSTRSFLAPFSRLFSAGQISPAEQSPKPTLTGLRPSARPVPKQMASSAITSDTVVVKRQVSSTLAPGGEDRGLAAPSRPADRKGNDGRLLRSIFAGGSGMRTTSWTSGAGNASAAPTGRQMSSIPLTQATDAVLDSFSRTGDEDYRPNLLERQLRPRGLSDSSIRSTFVAHAIPNTIRPANIAISTHAYIPDEDVHATLTTDSLKARDQLSRKFSRQHLTSPIASSSPSSGLPSLSSSPVAVPVGKLNRPEPSPSLLSNLQSWATSLNTFEQGHIQALSSHAERKRDVPSL